MREIKFRVWDKTCNGWLKDFVVYQYGNVSSSGVWLQDSEAHVMMYTGLKDKNGKEIYESDFIECDGEVYEVFWCDDSLSFQAKSKEDCLALSEFRGDAFVQGNIYENPELL